MLCIAAARSVSYSAAVVKPRDTCVQYAVARLTP